MFENIFEIIKPYEPQTIAWQEYFHRIPERSNEEFQTMEAIKAELDKMEIPWVYIPDGGILGTIEGGKEGKTVLLRADIDGLPVEESPCNLKTGRKVVSEHPGFCHACGHDAHIAMLLTEAKILKDHQAEIPGKILLLFEQGEEMSEDIRNVMIYLDAHPELNIDTCYGTHVRWNLPTGKVSIQPGAAMSGILVYRGKITGLGGHGSRPDLAVSPLDCFVTMYQALCQLRMAKTEPTKALTWSFGKVNTGFACNVIADTLEFEGTIRFFDVPTLMQFWPEFKRRCYGICESYGCTLELDTSTCMPPTLSDPVCAELGKNAVLNRMGAEYYQPIEAWMASESMSLPLCSWPGVYSFTGIMNEQKGTGANHHNPAFEIDQDAMRIGVAAALSYTAEFLEKKPEIPFRRTFSSLEEMLAFCTMK